MKTPVRTFRSVTSDSRLIVLMNQQLRIAVIVPHKFIPPLNGGHKVCLDLCQFAGIDHHLTCFTVSSNAVCEENSFMTIGLFPNGRWKYAHPLSFFRLLMACRSESFDFCIVNQPYMFPLAWLACRLSNTPIITYFHNIEFLRLSSIKRQKKNLRRLFFPFLIRLLEQQCFRRSDVNLFISKHEMNESVQLFSCSNDDKSFFLPHLISNTHTPYRQASTEIIRIAFSANFSYPPNRTALLRIIDPILPLLRQTLDKRFQIDIFGQGLQCVDLLTRIATNPELVHHGFVGNLNHHLVKASVFINPVEYGGGAQTKSIQALALGIPLVSTSSAAKGLDVESCGNFVTVVEDGDWENFVRGIVDHHRSLECRRALPDQFFDTYFWGNAIPRVLAHVTDKIARNNKRI
jgi:polysaccharide biosynthesis protein PslH